MKLHFYSLSLCHSAICLLGEESTSFQWWRAEPVQWGPPSSRRPITCKENIVVHQKCKTHSLMSILSLPSRRQFLLLLWHNTYEEDNQRREKGRRCIRNERLLPRSRRVYYHVGVVGRKRGERALIFFCSNFFTFFCI